MLKEKKNDLLVLKEHLMGHISNDILLVPAERDSILN